MPKMSLTDFIDVVSRAGTARTTKVAQIKNRPKYDPAFDFYKKIREAIADTHQNGQNRAHLAALLGALTDPKKQVNYPAVVAGYSKWWGRKTIKWFDPPTAKFTHAEFTVAINPELGLEVNGQPHVIKLYFKGDQLTKQRTLIATGLMEHSLRGSVPAGTTLGLLDIRNSRLFPSQALTPTILAGLQAELAFIAALWPHV
jgi:hypothetical protein